MPLSILLNLWGRSKVPEYIDTRSAENGIGKTAVVKDYQMPASEGIPGAYSRKVSQQASDNP